MRWDAKADENQREIVLAIRQIGGQVQSLHRVGQGVPDLLVAYRGQWYVIEVKANGGTLTEKEEDWHARFGHLAPIMVVTSWAEVIDALMLESHA